MNQTQKTGHINRCIVVMLNSSAQQSTEADFFSFFQTKLKEQILSQIFSNVAWVPLPHFSHNFTCSQVFFNVIDDTIF